MYGARLDSSSGRILLQGLPGVLLFCYQSNYQGNIRWTNKKSYVYSGTDLYQERLVRALARDVQVPLLVLDSSVLAPYVRYFFMSNLPVTSHLLLFCFFCVCYIIFLGSGSGFF